MILFQLFLILGLVVALVWFLPKGSATHIRAWKRILFVLFIAFSVFAVLFPNSTNDLAHVVGIGRGADLLLYCLVIAVVFLGLNLYVMLKDEQRRTTQLARRLAILDANQRYQNDNDRKTLIE